MLTLEFYPVESEEESDPDSMLTLRGGTPCALFEELQASIGFAIEAEHDDKDRYRILDSEGNLIGAAYID
jgi:hypothetical protein